MILSLMGLPGSGIKEIGSLLARKTGFPLRVTDDLIEQTYGKPVSRMQSELGETGFRRIERDILCAVLDEYAGKNLILVCGDGMPVSPYMKRKLRENTRAVWIKKSVKAIASDKENYAAFPYCGDRLKFIDACVERYRAYESLAVQTVESENNEVCAAFLTSYLHADKGEELWTIP